jgi:ADP-ribose pyrophosphatase YjhB (NUDIX family)
LLSYKDPDFPEERIRLSDKEYERALLAFPIVCADVVLIDAERRAFYLADRIVHPVKGWWWIGGRIFRGEDPLEAARRKLDQESAVVLDTTRFRYIKMLRHMMTVRQQEPQNAGTDTIAYTYAAAVSVKEANQVSIGLVHSEYRLGSLRSFTREELHAENIRPQIRDLYDLVFP